MSLVTFKEIFNLRVLCEKYSQHQQYLYHVFIDFKKAFDRVWHDALWATMKKYNMGQKITNAIKQLYDKASSAVIIQGSMGQWFRTIVGVWQGCLLWRDKNISLKTKIRLLHALVL